MRATNSPRRHPAGFTLVELLVVISIIGILMGLLLGAVQKVRDVGRRTSTVSEINQLDMAVTKFKLDFGFNPPHRIRLPGVVPDTTSATPWSGYAKGTPERESFEGYQLLLQMFPRWQVGTVAVTTLAAGTATGISYRGTAAPANANGLPLEGSQCLVFFLGGPDLGGFKPSGPYKPDLGATSIKGPYYEFAANRMDTSTLPRISLPVGLPSSSVSVPNGYLNGYLDPYGTPYAYFSTVTATNYDPSYAWAPPGKVVAPTVVAQATLDVSDYVANTPTSGSTLYLMRPYQEAANKGINPGRVQIISAGKNKKFGPGTEGDYATTGLTVTRQWTAGGKLYSMDSGSVPKLKNATTSENSDGIGGDDLTNFNGGAQLGAVGS